MGGGKWTGAMLHGQSLLLVQQAVLAGACSCWLHHLLSACTCHLGVYDRSEVVSRVCGGRVLLAGVMNTYW
jgi:hypothetical protein